MSECADLEARIAELEQALGRCLEKATKHDDGDIEAIARQALGIHAE